MLTVCAVRAAYCSLKCDIAVCASERTRTKWELIISSHFHRLSGCVQSVWKAHVLFKAAAVG